MSCRACGYFSLRPLHISLYGCEFAAQSHRMSLVGSFHIHSSIDCYAILHKRKMTLLNGRCEFECCAVNGSCLTHVPCVLRRWWICAEYDLRNDLLYRFVLPQNPVLYDQVPMYMHLILVIRIAYVVCGILHGISWC